MTQPDSACPAGRPGQYHNWLVYKHTRTWKVLWARCSRCPANCAMSMRDYVSVQEAADREWRAFLNRPSTKSSPATL